MTSAVTSAAMRVDEGATGHASMAWWGMLLFLLNEATLFASLIASYFFLATANASWPPAGVEKPALALPLIMTAALLSSSVALVYGERGLERGNRRHYRIGVLTTIVLGLVFLGLQLKEYIEKLQTLTPSQNSYGSVFYTITGLHGAHVLFGLLFLGWALAREMNGTATAASYGLKNASLYWHFVDGVWLVILTSLYLSPRWM
ncbi:MAG TPA: cytochrome c oxidase subunit 3 [Gemmatimonadaceae bacterium]